MNDAPPQRPLLIISGDDFGLTPGVSEGILRAHQHGVLTATSALTNAPAFDRYGPALASSGLDVGLHICFVGEDPPLLSPTEIPTLVTPGGGLHRDWKQFLRRWMRGRIDPDDLTREAEAQFDALIATGRPPPTSTPTSTFTCGLHWPTSPSPWRPDGRWPPSGCP